MWFAMVGKRMLHGTTARTRSPAANPEPRKTSAWSARTGTPTTSARVEVVVTLDPALVGDLAAARAR